MRVVHLGPYPWLQSQQTALPSLVLESTWANAGATVIIYLAALTGVNSELYEAAAVDGASLWRKIWHITLPQLRGVLGSLAGGFVQYVRQGGEGTNNQFSSFDSRTYSPTQATTSKIEWQAVRGNKFISVQSGAWIWNVTRQCYSNEVSTTDQLTTRTTGCTNNYKCWLLPPGGSWRAVQAYGVGSTWVWNTAGYGAGVRRRLPFWTWCKG